MHVMHFNLLTNVQNIAMHMSNASLSKPISGLTHIIDVIIHIVLTSTACYVPGNIS